VFSFYGGMWPDRNSTTIVRNGDGLVLMNSHVDVLTKAGHGLVDRVIYDFVNKMVKSVGSSRADIHRWTFSNSLETLQDFDIFPGVTSLRNFGTLFAHI